MSFALRRCRSQHLYTNPTKIVDIKRELIYPDSQEESNEQKVNELGIFSEPWNEYRFLVLYAKAGDQDNKSKKVWVKDILQKMDKEQVYEMLDDFRFSLKDQKMNHDLRIFASKQIR